MFSRHKSRWSTIGIGLPTMLLVLIAMAPAPAQASPPNYDVAALGATASGKAGDVIRIQIGIINHGPQAYPHMQQGSWAVTWRFDLPPGTVTVPGPRTEAQSVGQVGQGMPSGCDQGTPSDRIDGRTNAEDLYGYSSYDCWSANPFEPNHPLTVTFHLKINKVIPNATGMVRRLIRDDFPTDKDAEESNDKAAVVINPDPDVLTTVAGLPITRTTAIAAVAVLALLTAAGVYWHVYNRAR